MTKQQETPAEKPGEAAEAIPQVVDWGAATPVFADRLIAPKAAARPSDGAIKMAQRSYDGEKHGDDILHVLRHRFPTPEMAEAAADELKRAGGFTSPESTVRVAIDPDRSGDLRMVAWSAGAKRGRKT